MQPNRGQYGKRRRRLPGCRGSSRPGRAITGVSLIEVMAAVVVVAIGMAATLTMLMVASAHSTYEQERARANQLVCQYMEERVIFTPLPDINCVREITVWDNGTPNNAADDTRGTIEILVFNPENGTRITSYPINKINRVRYRVEVTLTWNPRGSRSNRTLRETVMTYKVA